MMLDCEVMRDLFPMYKDNDISQKVRDRIDSHLVDCQDCSKLYAGKRSFKDVLGSLDEKDEARVYDQKLLPGMSFRFLGSWVTVAIIIAALLLSNVAQYNRLRGILFSEINTTAHSIEFLSRDEKLSDLLGTLWRLDRYLNRFESKHYDLGLFRMISGSRMIFGRNELEAFLATIELRKENGTFGEADELALSSFDYAIGSVGNVLNDFQFRYARRGLTKTLVQLDVELLAEHVAFLRETAMSYLLYNQLLTNASVNTAEEGLMLFPGFENANAKVFGTDLSFWGQLPTNGNFDFKVIQGNSTLYQGKVNAYTGLVQELKIMEVRVGEAISIDDIRDTVELMLETLDWQFDVQYLGVSSDTTLYLGESLDLHQFSIIPLVDGWPYTEGALLLYYLTDGQLAGILPSREGAAIVWPASIDGKVVVIPEEAEYYENKTRFSFVETTIIRSMVSGEYELVHAYKHVVSADSGRDHEIWVFLNAVTGGKEIAVWSRQFSPRQR